MSQPQPPAAAFMAAAQAAMNDIQRSRTQAGVSAADPLNPLVEALARTVGVLGQMPAALAQQQQAAENAAVAGMEEALAAALRDLVDRSGAAAARGYQAKWIGITTAAVAVILAGVGWWSYERGRADAGAVHARELAALDAGFKAQMSQVIADAPATAQWAATVLSAANREQASWAAALPRDEFRQAQWALTQEGRTARRLNDANGAIGGVIGIAQCRQGKTVVQDGKQACQAPPAYWMP